MSPPVLLSPLLLLVLSLGAPGVAVGTIDEGSRPGASLGSATTAQIGDRQIEVRPRLLHGILVDGAREVRINRPGVNLVLEQGEHPPTGTADPGPLPQPAAAPAPPGNAIPASRRAPSVAAVDPIPRLRIRAAAAAASRDSPVRAQAATAAL